MLGRTIFLTVLIILNGIFSATEIAFLSIDKHSLRKDISKGKKNSKKIANLLNDTSSFLSAIQVVITLSGFLASAFAAESFASELTDLTSHIFSFMSYNVLLHTYIILITLILSFFTLVFGELVPKKIGLAYSNKIAYIMIKPILIVMKIFKPFIYILKISTDFIVKIFRIKKKKEDDTDLKNTIIDANLEELEKKILLNVFDFNDITVKEVMTPINEVVAIDINDEKSKFFKTLEKYKYTRYPVIENGKIIGLLNIKDIIVGYEQNKNLKDFVRKIKCVDSNSILDDVFLELNSNYEAFALVKDKELDKFIGIVTIEDILEYIIGDIFDEHDKK